MRIDLQRRFPWVRSWRPVLLTVAALGLWNCTCSARGQAADVTIRLRSDQLGPAISPRLIGAFFEDINFGADGGFSAELVINGSFECPSDLLGWRIVGRDVSVRRSGKHRSAQPIRLSCGSCPLRIESTEGWSTPVTAAWVSRRVSRTGCR